MKILFAYKGRYHVRETETIERMSAIALKYHADTMLYYDQDIFGISDNIIQSRFLNKLFSVNLSYQKADLVVFLDCISTRGWAVKAAKKLKSYKTKTVNVSLSWKNEVFDYNLSGEPENVFELFARNGFKTDIESKNVSPLDLFPLPDKNIFSKYINFKDSYIIYASKGCAYNCSYCQESIYKNELGGKYFRQRSVENVMEELINAKNKFDIKEVIFKDSILTINQNWFFNLADRFKKEINVPYKCFSKAGSFSNEIAKKLKETGCYCVEFGMQTLNADLKAKHLRRAESLAELKKAFKICDDTGLRYDIDYMFNLPHETNEDHVAAFNLFKECGMLNRIKCHNLVVLPQTDISVSNQVNCQNTGFHSAVSGTNKNFEKLFKIFPVVPVCFLDMLVSKNHLMKYVPDFFVKILQALTGLRKNDLRFKFYLKYYPLKIVSAIRGN